MIPSKEITVTDKRCPECGRLIIIETIYNEYNQVTNEIEQCSKCLWINKPKMIPIDKFLKQIGVTNDRKK